MFKNRELKINAKLVKPGTETETAPVAPRIQITKNDITDVANGVMKTAAVAVISVIAAKSASRIVEEIAIHHGTK